MIVATQGKTAPLSGAIAGEAKVVRELFSSTKT